MFLSWKLVTNLAEQTFEIFVKLLDSQKKQSHLYLSPNMTCQIV